MANADIRQLEMDGKVFYPQTDIHGLVNNGAYAIDNEPTEGSSNLVTSDSVYRIKSETLQENREMVNSIMEDYAPVEITGNVNNAADEEDLTSTNVSGTDVLKFKDKVYNQLVYSGLGKKILRKNMVNGVNTLTQSMINDENTIYVIQYDFVLGEDITIPSNCILDFYGGSISGTYTLTFSNTKITGNPNIDAVNISGSLANSIIYSYWFNLDRTGSTDVTTKFKNIIKVIYNSALGEGKQPILHINRGDYLFNSTVIDNTIGLYFPQFNIEGEGYQNTILHFNGSGFFIDNNALFQFSRFSDLSFDGKSDFTNSFMNLYNTGDGRPQSLVFERCLWNNFQKVFVANGIESTSEFVFYSCKIRRVGDSATCNGIAFDLNNPQLVNWRFYATDMEGIWGDFFKIKDGGQITLNQCSLICGGSSTTSFSSFIHFPSDAIEAGLNMVSVAINQCRFEPRNYCKLIFDEKESSRPYIIFDGCGMGGYNITSDSNFYPIDIQGACNIIFRNCAAYDNYKIKHDWDINVGVPARIYTDSFGVSQLLRSNNIDYYKGNQAIGRLFIINEITGETFDVNGLKIPTFNANYIEISETINWTPYSNLISMFNPANPVTTNISKFAKVTGIKIIGYPDTSQSNISIDIKITAINMDGTIGSVLVQGNYMMHSGGVIDSTFTVPVDISGLKTEVWSSTTSESMLVQAFGLVILKHF